jgi:phosphoribosylformylglycinamidine cyclo-ligase
MLQIFNCGIGYVIIVPQESVDEVLRRVSALQLSAWQIGSIERVKKSAGEERVRMHFPA